MTDATAYALAAMICYGLADFAFKRAAQAGVTPHHFLIVHAWCFCPLVVLYAWLSGMPPGTVPALWGGLAGLFICLGFYNFLRSLASGPISINVPIFRLHFVVTVALAAVVLGEAVTAGRIAGIAAAIAAVWLLLGGAAPNSGRRVSTRSLAQVLAAAAAFGVANFCHKLGLIAGAPPEALLVAQAVVFVMVATLSAFSVKGDMRPPAATWAHSAPAAPLVVAGFLLFLHALARGDATVLVPIAQMGFVPPIVLGIAALGEPPRFRTVAGLVVAVAALMLLAAS